MKLPTWYLRGVRGPQCVLCRTEQLHCVIGEKFANAFHPGCKQTLQTAKRLPATAIDFERFPPSRLTGTASNLTNPGLSV